jgi:hypothetical protein
MTRRYMSLEMLRVTRLVSDDVLQSACCERFARMAQYQGSESSALPCQTSDIQAFIHLTTETRGTKNVRLPYDSKHSIT